MNKIFHLCIILQISALAEAQVPCVVSNNTWTPIQIGYNQAPAVQFQQYAANSANANNFTTQLINGTTYYIIQDLSVSNNDGNVNGGNSIMIKGLDHLKIQRCFLHGAYHAAIYIEDCSDVTIEENNIQDADLGVYALSSHPLMQNNVLLAKASGINVLNNQIKNIWSRNSSGHAIAFWGVNTYDPITQTEMQSVISGNLIEDVPYLSDPEDIINISLSFGTSALPILIENNFIHGGGPSTSGSGIVVGDQDEVRTIVHLNSEV